MKLRMRGNSIRLRLTQSEVARLGEQGPIEEVCDFGDGRQFRYALQSRADVPDITASLNGSAITVTVPAALATEWAGNNETGIYGAAGAIDIAIEKDFRCMSHPTDAEEADAFPNPAARC